MRIQIANAATEPPTHLWFEFKRSNLNHQCPFKSPMRQFKRQRIENRKTIKKLIKTIIQQIVTFLRLLVDRLTSLGPTTRQKTPTG